MNNYPRMAQSQSQRPLSAVATANSKFITSRIDPNARIAEVDVGNYPIKAVDVVAQDAVIDRICPSAFELGHASYFAESRLT